MTSTKKQFSPTASQASNLWTEGSSETRAVLHGLDLTISKLAKLRELLCDPAIFMFAKNAFHAHSKRPSAIARAGSPECTPHTGRVSAVYECVNQFGDELFSKRDIAVRLREADYIIEKPKDQLKFAINSLLAEGLIRLVQPCVGPRPS